MRSRSFFVRTAASGAALVAIGLSGTSAQAARPSGGGHNPPGNNGTVFVHGVAGDQRPHNVPHVDCQFFLDFFGFDAGQEATLDFVGQAPTGKVTSLLHVDALTVSDDDAGGAGNDFDSEWPFTADELGVTSLGTPARAGYHVKLTLHTGRPGVNGVKHKVFWLEPCTAPSSGPTVAPTGGPTETDVPTGSPTAPSTVTSIQTATGGGASSRRSTETSVLGEHFTRPASNQQPRRSLPFTGAVLWTLVAVGAATLAAGFIVTILGAMSRPRRTH